jgi:elongator complex protein 3
MLVAAYRDLVERGIWSPNPDLLNRIRLKPVRSLSGVATVTVLTKPFPCPGRCIFCPTDERMPKSYLPDEPGARRGVEHQFDPFGQVTSRLESLAAVGHPVDKIELLILGGTWSAYIREYQEWFITRCFDALNGVESSSLAEAHSRNESGEHRNVGLVIETRPDYIDPKELVWLRYLGVTKVQMGVQSLDDDILECNQRGHSVADTRQAVAWLRAAGFKIVLHWMPNLLGATPDSDRTDFNRLWQGICPDEIKIYPNQLLRNTALYEYWKRGEYQPYSTQELVSLIADIKPSIPRYCRVNRVIRDIPSTEVIAGNKRSSLRQDISEELSRRGLQCSCIRCREIGNRKVHPDELIEDDIIYQVGDTEEHFLSYNTQDDFLVGFIRLSFPGQFAPLPELPDLNGAAIIREVHIYGQSLQFGENQSGAAQHVGLGTQLTIRAEQLAKSKGYYSMAVISAVGTRNYYLNRGYQRGQYYLVKALG